MKNTLLLIALLVVSFMANAQDAERVNDVLGYRLKYGAADMVIFEDSAGVPGYTFWRKLNYRFYYRLVEGKEYKDEKTNKEYVLITIPGKTYEEDQTKKLKACVQDLNGSPVSAKDFGRNFWMEKKLLLASNEQFFKYRNDVCFGILTIPFRLRPAVGSQAPSLVNGSINIGTYAGWKFRLSGIRPMFICPIASAGITSLLYNKANNPGITDDTQEQNGFGLQYCGGVVFDFYKIQTGVVFGGDYGTGDLAKTYVYQNNLWFSLSINFNFLTPQLDKKVENN